jgi:ABC-type sugar transport system ATPase subunit
MLYVTHDQVEAMTLADRLVVLNGGRVEQQGPPLEVYHHPASKFVAAFLGMPPMNFVEARVGDGGTHAEAPGLRVALDRARFANVSAGQKVTVGVRPHDMTRARGAEGAGYRDASPERRPAIELRVEVVEAMGFEAYAHGTVGEGPFVARLEGAQGSLPRPGETLPLDVDPAAVHLFDAETGRTLDTRGARS